MIFIEDIAMLWNNITTILNLSVSSIPWTSAATDMHLSGIKNSGDPHRIYFVFKTLAENNIYNIDVDANRPQEK